MYIQWVPEELVRRRVLKRAKDASVLGTATVSLRETLGSVEPMAAGTS